MAKRRSPELTAAQPKDAERLASLSPAAKLTYRDWAHSDRGPPSLAAERARWERRLADPAGWTLIAADSSAAVGAVHFTDARTERGDGEAIAGLAHLSGLFVLKTMWGKGIGSLLLEEALAAMRSRGYRKVQLYTAAANQRSRSFYERRGWRVTAIPTHKHDDLWLASYEHSLAG